MRSWASIASAALLVVNPLLGAASPVASSSSSLAKRNSTSTCSSINQRKSWNVLTNDEKSDFLDAYKTLMESPPKVGTIWNAQNRWDEFHFVHIHLVNFIHNAGQFLPWHRWFVRCLELALQEEVGYTGALPYWDELKDQATAPLNESSMFDPVYGFGGNGDSSNNNYISDGPFANITLVMNQTGNFDSYHIYREFDQDRFDEGPSNWDDCKDIDNYPDYWDCNFFGLHLLGHNSIGGLMANGITSPGDPTFFLHHAWLDRAWWKWQLQDKEARLQDMGGSVSGTTLEGYLTSGLSPPNMYLLDYDGDDGNETTLNHVLYTYDLRANVTVGDVMDLNGDTICAEYVDDGDFNYTLGY